MTRLHTALVAIACLAPGLALPGLARADMTCAEFNGMDAQSQAEMVGSMADAGEGGMDASETRESGEGAGEDAEVVADDGLMAAVKETCRQNPGSALGDALGTAGTNGGTEAGDDG